MTPEREEHKGTPDKDGFASKIRHLFGRSAKWILGCALAGLAVIVTSMATDVGHKAVRSVKDSYCALTLNKKPEPTRFRVVVARLANDKDALVQERIAAQLVPTSFSVVRGCVEGPTIFDVKGGNFDERARRQATQQLTPLAADVLIFGRIDGDKAALRFADRNGHCSNVAKVVPISDLDQEVTRSAFARALANHTISALVSDCDGKKINTLSQPQLVEFAQKINYIATSYGKTGEPDVKLNLWVYRAWVEARLAMMRGGEDGAQEALEQIVDGAPDLYAKAASLWGLDLFASRHELPALRQRVREEAFIASRTWKKSSPAWVSVAMLARDQIQKEHANDPNWKLPYYDALTDRAGAEKDGYVPMSDSEVSRSYYIFAWAVIDAPQPTDKQIESAVSLLTNLLKKKLKGESVPVTENALRFSLAEALVVSAHRQKTPSRLVRASILVTYIEEHPDGTKDLTPGLISRLHKKLRAECERQHCTLASSPA